MAAAKGILTREGGHGSHAALVARGKGWPCVIGVARPARSTSRPQVSRVGGRRCSRRAARDRDRRHHRRRDDRRRPAGRARDLASTSSACWAGATSGGGSACARTPTWARTPRAAVEMGAEGIGLCRTEHTLLSDEHKPKVAAMIMATTDEERRERLEVLLPAAAATVFVDLFDAMAGRPVTVRLLDPPLHEFLPGPRRPRRGARPARGARRGGADRGPRRTSSELEEELERAAPLPRQVLEIHEENPMLGTRGCRLGILYPEIYEMQVAGAHAGASRPCAPSAASRRRTWRSWSRSSTTSRSCACIRELIVARRRRARHDRGRGLLDRHDDRAAAGVLRGRPDRRARRVLLLRHQRPDPDRARLLARRRRVEVRARSTWSGGSSTARRSRRSTSRASAGSCGWPRGSGARRGRTSSSASAASTAATRTSIDFFHMAGLDYVSCSPFRIPIARVAAAQAAIRHADDEQL